MTKISWTKLIFIPFYIFFIVNIPRIYHSHNPELIFDMIVSIALLTIILIQHHRWKFTTSSILVALAALYLHSAKLYGNTYYGVPFDRIMHFIAGAAMALLFYQILRPHHKSIFNLAIYTILISAGLGSMLEMTEYLGYASIVGEGEGILGFGEGDYGEWANASWDMFMNTLGALIGTLYMLLIHNRLKSLPIRQTRNRKIILK